MRAYDGIVIEAEPARYQFGTVEVQPAAFTVTRDGRLAELEPKAVRVLVYLIEHRDRAVTKEELVETVWEGAAVTDNSLTRIVAQIRREIGDDARHARYIQTLHTTGYRFIADVKVVPGKVVQAPHVPRGRTRRVRLISGALAAVILAIAGWQLTKRGFWGTADALRCVQLTTSNGLDIGARFSPDGESFVYSSNRSGRFEIYRRPVASSAGEVQITNDGKQNVNPAWSPDGKWIAYHSVVQHGIWVVAANGGPPRRLSAFGSAPAWSPDGRQIAFSSVEPNSFAWFSTGSGIPTIWVVAADGSHLRRATSTNLPPGPHVMPDWSPDGKHLVFVVLRGNDAVYSVDLGSGKLEMLVQMGSDIPRRPGSRDARLVNPRLHPLGKCLYFSAISERGEHAIYWLPHSGDRPRELYVTGRDAPADIAFSADGQRLLFTRYSNNSRLEMVAPGSAPKPLFQESVLRVSIPSFSPDGQRLAFCVETAGRNSDLWIMNADGTGVAPVTSDPGPKESGTIWNQAGALLYNYVDGSRIEFRRYDPVRRTTQVVCSRPAPSELFLPRLMPDERQILSACSIPRNICLSPLQGGPPRQLTFEREAASYPFVSHDGQWISYQVWRGDTRQIGITDREGRRQEILTNDPSLNFPYSFSSDNRRIAYAAYRDGVWNIWWIDRITRERKQLTHYTAYGSYVRAPSWRPGTEEVVYEHTQGKGNVYVLTLP